MANSIFIKADELAKELDISQGLAYKMIAQWNEELRAKGYTTVGGRVSRRYYQEKIQLRQRLRDRDQTENFQRQVRHLPAGGSSHPEDGSRGQL